MAKPRNSVLYLFDPLHQAPSTPRRDSSDDCGPSDKENDIPPGDLTVFFNRTFAHHKQAQAQALTPHGKLIDFGETPTTERLWDAAEHDGSDADGEQSESDAESGGVLSPSRVPFAELDVEHTPRPQESKEPLKALVFANPSLPSQCPLPALLGPAPQNSPLAEVINSINFSSMSLSESISASSSLPAQETEIVHAAPSRPSSPFPEINVCAPQTPVTEGFDTSQEQYDPPTAASHLRPPTSLTQLSSEDQRRTSVDLYSSFHMQMESTDMSFDLLNDKVSFFGNGQDSFWSGGDDTLDFGELCVPAAMKAKLDQFVAAPAADTASKYEAVFSPPAKTVFTPPSKAMLNTPIMSPTTETALNVPLPVSPTFSAPSFCNITPARVPPPVFAAPPSPPTSPVAVDEPSLLLESEPLPPPISAPVPALRIVKKTFKLAGHQSTVPAPSSTKTVESLPQRRTSLASTKPAAAPPPQVVRPAFRGVQRPPPGVVVGLPPQGSSISTAASTTSNTSSSSSGAGTRSARAAEGVAPSRFAGIQRPNLAAHERAPPRVTTAAVPRTATVAGTKATGIARMASSGAPRSISSVVGASALRPPSRGGVALSGSTALPKPASRLPGPSGLARTTSMSSRSGIGSSSSGTAASRARASTLSRVSRF